MGDIPESGGMAAKRCEMERIRFFPASELVYAEELVDDFLECSLVSESTVRTLTISLSEGSGVLERDGDGIAPN